jgi:hypothetical protein
MNHKKIKNVLLRINENAPKAPLRGKGFERHEVNEAVHNLMRKHAPAHCIEILQRAPINRFGKIGYTRQYFVSPELFIKYEKYKQENDIAANALQILNNSELCK